MTAQTPIGSGVRRPPVPVAADSAPIILSVRNLSYRCGEQLLLADVSLDLCRGEALGVLGPPGAGKTLLTRLICGFLQPERGTVVVGNEAHQRVDQDRRRRTVSHVCADATVHDSLTVEETLEIWARSRLSPQARSVPEVLELAGLEAWRDVALDNCFQHQRCALAVAAALLERPQVLVLDEPFSQVDPRFRPALLTMLSRLCSTRPGDGGTSVVYATRHQGDVDVLCDRTLRLTAGRACAVPTGQVG